MARLAFFATMKDCLPGHCVLPDAMEQARQGSELVRHQLLRWRFSDGELVQCTEQVATANGGALDNLQVSPDVGA